MQHRPQVKKEEQFLAALKTISTLLFNKNNLLFGVTAESQELDYLAKKGSCITDSLADTPVKS